MTTITRFTKEQLIARINKQIDINATIIERLGDDSAAVSELAVKTATMDMKILDAAAASLTAPPVYQAQYGNDWRDVERAQYDDHAAHGSPVRIVYAAPPAPVSVPVALNRLRSIVADPRALPRRKEWISGQQYSYVLLENVEAMVDDACRAALLQGSQPVSNRDELPLDYLQGHKDGLEWAAQLAEANHPQTGDWLYDDPIALASAIRKGPDMPELKSAFADEDDNFYSWFGRFWLENYQQNNYTTSAKQMLGTMAEFAFRAGRESATQAGNSPVIPDGYIVVPKRLTAENGAKSLLVGEFSETKFINCPECFGDGECETCDGSGRIEISVPVSWTNIKAIWAKGVEHFAAVSKQEAL